MKLTKIYLSKIASDNGEYSLGAYHYWYHLSFNNNTSTFRAIMSEQCANNLAESNNISITHE